MARTDAWLAREHEISTPLGIRILNSALEGLTNPDEVIPDDQEVLGPTGQLQGELQATNLTKACIRPPHQVFSLSGGNNAVWADDGFPVKSCQVVHEKAGHHLKGPVYNVSVIATVKSPK